MFLCCLGFVLGGGGWGTGEGFYEMIMTPETPEHQ